MEELTKHQLILVALLVSFVTSIATGIVTVALMEQAPQGVTETINHVIQETVAQAVSSPSGATASAASSVASTQTVKVISSDAQLISAVGQSSNGLARIVALAAPYPPVFLGLGVVVTSDGVIVTGSGTLSSGSDYAAIIGNSTTTAPVPITLIAQNSTSQLAYFKVAPPTAVPDSASATSSSSGQLATSTLSALPLQTYAKAVLGNSDQLQIGQDIFAVGGENSTTISRGVITGLYSDSGGLEQISTDALPQDLAAPLVDLNGEVIGLEISNPSSVSASASASAAAASSGGSLFLPINQVKSQLAAITAKVD